MNIPFNDVYTIINMDETPCYLEMEFDTTFGSTREKNLDFLSSGHNSFRVSLILTVVESGFKLPPLLILNGKPRKTV